MRSVAVAAVSNIVACSVSLYKAHRSLYTHFYDGFIVQASREDSRPLLRAYMTFVVFGIVLTRSNNFQTCVHFAPTGTRYILQVDCWGFLFLAHGGIEQARWSCLLLAKPFRMAIRRMMHHRRRPCSLSVILYPLFRKSQRKCNSYIPWAIFNSAPNYVKYIWYSISRTYSDMVSE